MVQHTLVNMISSHRRATEVFMMRYSKTGEYHPPMPRQIHSSLAGIVPKVVYVVMKGYNLIIGSCRASNPPNSPRNDQIRRLTSRQIELDPAVVGGNPSKQKLRM